MRVVSKFLICFLLKHLVKAQVAFQVSLYRNQPWGCSSIILFRFCRRFGDRYSHHLLGGSISPEEHEARYAPDMILDQTVLS